MPRKTEDVGAEATPHFDGKSEGMLQDSTGVQMGVDINDRQTKNPFQLRKKDKDLQRFEELMKGDSPNQS